MTALPPVGARVRLTADVDRWPHFIAPRGATGVVVDRTPDWYAVRLDVRLEGAAEWDNEVIWNDLDGPPAVALEDAPLQDALAWAQTLAAEHGGRTVWPLEGGPA